MNKTISPKITALTFGVLAVAFLAVFYVIAWQEPTQAPPGGNVPAPLNIGPTGQSKEGGLILNTGGAANGLIVDKGNLCLGTDCRSTWPGGGGLAIYGDGSDGDKTISSNTTLTRDMFYNNLTVNNGITLITGGYRVFARGTLTNNGVIANNGSNGLNGLLYQYGVDGGSGAMWGTIGGGANGGCGQNYTLKESTANIFCSGAGLVGLGGSGGRGGRGNYNICGGGYPISDGYRLGGVVTPAKSGGRALPVAISGWETTSGGRIGGGAGGGGGGCAGNNGEIGGGSGGGGGGVIIIVAKTINNLSGIIQANGGNGGNAYDGDLGYGGNAGGGGGGGGGSIILIYDFVTNWGTEQAASGTGGLGRLGGENGANGTIGTIIKIVNQ